MEGDPLAVGEFRKLFARYMRYLDAECDDFDILRVSFQFLSGTRDQQLTEVVGLVKSRELLKAVPAPRIGYLS